MLPVSLCLCFLPFYCSKVADSKEEAGEFCSEHHTFKAAFPRTADPQNQF